MESPGEQKSCGESSEIKQGDDRQREADDAAVQDNGHTQQHPAARREQRLQRFHRPDIHQTGLFRSQRIPKNYLRCFDEE